MGDAGQRGVMGQMGMFIIGLFCMVFYCVLIFFSVFQNDWCSGGAQGGALGGGWDDGSKQLPAITSSIRREGIPSFTAACSLSSCAMGLCRLRYNIITSTRGG